MTSLSTPFPPTAGTRNDRLAGVGVTLAVHLALILGWQMAGKLPSMPQEGSDEAMQWISLPLLPTREPRVEPAAPEPVKEVRPASVAAPMQAARTAPAPASPVAQAPAPTAVDEQPAALPGAADILANARRSVGEIDRALRKENSP